MLLHPTQQSVHGGGLHKLEPKETRQPTRSPNRRTPALHRTFREAKLACSPGSLSEYNRYRIGNWLHFLLRFHSGWHIRHCSTLEFTDYVGFRLWIADVGWLGADLRRPARRPRRTCGSQTLLQQEVRKELGNTGSAGTDTWT